MDKETTRLVGVVGYLEGEVEETRLKMSAIRRELLKAESELVGRKERLLKAKESLRRHAQSVVKREVTSREANIARLLNVDLHVGEKLTDEQWAEICSHRCS